MRRNDAAGVERQDIRNGYLSGVTDALRCSVGVLEVKVALKRSLSSVTVCSAALCALLSFSVDNEPDGVMGRSRRNIARRSARTRKYRRVAANRVWENEAASAHRASRRRRGGCIAISRASQRHERPRRLGVLMGNAESDPLGQARIAALRAGLRELGWSEGGNLTVDVRWVGSDTAVRRPALM